MTFQITRRDFLRLTEAEQSVIVNALYEATLNRNLVAIRIAEYGNDMFLYGMYCMSEDEYRNYMLSGGVWPYESPNSLIHELFPNRRPLLCADTKSLSVTAREPLLVAQLPSAATTSATSTAL